MTMCEFWLKVKAAKCAAKILYLLKRSVFMWLKNIFIIKFIKADNGKISCRAENSNGFLTAGGPAEDQGFMKCEENYCVFPSFGHWSIKNIAGTKVKLGVDCSKTKGGKNEDTYSVAVKDQTCQVRLLNQSGHGVDRRPPDYQNSSKNYFTSIPSD